MYVYVDAALPHPLYLHTITALTLHTHHPHLLPTPTTAPLDCDWMHGSLPSLPVGLAGLSISFALAVTQSLNWTVRMASDMEGQMVSVGKGGRKQWREGWREPMMLEYDNA